MEEEPSFFQAFTTSQGTYTITYILPLNLSGSKMTWDLKNSVVDLHGQLSVQLYKRSLP